MARPISASIASPRVPRRFAVALVAPPWAFIGPPRLGLLGDFGAIDSMPRIYKTKRVRETSSSAQPSPDRPDLWSGQRDGRETSEDRPTTGPGLPDHNAFRTSCFAAIFVPASGPDIMKRCVTRVAAPLAGAGLMSPADTSLMTAEEFLALPDDGKERWLIRGQLRQKGRCHDVSKSTAHVGRSQDRVSSEPLAARDVQRHAIALGRRCPAGPENRGSRPVSNRAVMPYRDSSPIITGLAVGRKNATFQSTDALPF